MTVGRLIAAGAASLAVAGCAVAVVGISRSAADRDSAASAASPVPHRAARYLVRIPDAPSVTGTPASTTPPAASASSSSTTTAPGTSTSRERSSSTAVSSAATSRPASSTTTTPPAPPVSSSSAPAPSSASTSHPPTTQAPTTHTSSTHSTSTHPAPPPSSASAPPATQPKSHPRRGTTLPLHMYVGRATRVITVVANSTSSTTARLQPWRKAPGGGWLRVGRPTLAHVGSDGLSRPASEYRSATPIGSFTLTQAFGRDANPGTGLTYFRTTPADWWISQPGKLYNTHRHCSSHCKFTQGDPNEHLYYETPYYNYAVVIDYNTRNAPGGVRQGRGSAFFLHVSVGQPTAGCVAIDQSRLVTIMRWLRPSAHPRILIGVR